MGKTKPKFRKDKNICIECGACTDMSYSDAIDICPVEAVLRID